MSEESLPLELKRSGAQCVWGMELGKPGRARLTAIKVRGQAAQGAAVAREPGRRVRGTRRKQPRL